MIIEQDYSHLIVAFNRRYTLPELQQMARARSGTFADELTERIHHCLFAQPKDIVKEHIEYYVIEYPDFAEFLFWKYGLSESTAEELEKAAGKGFYIAYGRDSLGLYSGDEFTKLVEAVVAPLEDQGNEGARGLRDQ